MKKLFLIFALGVLAVASQAQTNYGYTYIGQRYEWLAGLFKALGLPVGDSARFQVGQHQRQGAVYMDTVNTSGSPNGFYIYEDPTGGNSPFWNRQTSNFQICQNRLLTPWNVSWQGTGFNFTVHGGQPTGQGSYQIGCSFYTEDSLTVTLSPADPTLERIDVIYLDATGIHVREGDLAGVGLAQKPSVTLDEIELTFITVQPGTTEPTLTQLIVWNENTESTVTPNGTTADGNNLTNVFIGLKSVNVTNVNHNDIIDFIKVGATTWNILGYDGLSLAIKLKPSMPINTSCNIAVSLVVGTTVIGTEVIVPVTKSNTSTYQQITVPMSAFGNITNTNITTVRVRYLFPTASANIYAGFYLDYIYFVDGLNQPQTPGPAQFTLNMPIGFTVNPGNTAQSGGGWTVTNQAATTGQYYTKEGWVTLPDFVNSIGTLDGQAKDDDGGSILGNVFYFQLADTTYPGLLSPELYRKISRNDSVTNGNPGDTLLVKLNDTTLLVKALIAGTNIDFDITGNNITINSTASGGSGNPGEGMTESGDSIHLGGLVGAPGIFFNDRFINTNRKSMLWTNGKPLTAGGPDWIAGQPVWAPYQHISEDTLTANSIDPATQAMPYAGLYADRTLYYADGILKTQKYHGHVLVSRINFKDTMTFDNRGGDYNTGVKVEREITGRGTGIQRIGVHGTGSQNLPYFSTPTFISNTRLTNNGNGIHTWGYLAGISSYLTSTALDTIENFIFYQTNAFIVNTGYVKNAWQYDMQNYTAGARVQNSYGIRDQYGYPHWLRGNTFIGGGTSTMQTATDKLKVDGNFNLTDSMHLGKASLIGDSTGMDFVLRRRTDGALFRIRADLMTFLSGGGNRFGFAGEDDAAAGLDRSFSLGDQSFGIEGTGGGNINFQLTDGVDWTAKVTVVPQNVRISADFAGSEGYVNVSAGQILFKSDASNFKFETLTDDLSATKVVVYNTGDNKIGTVDLSGLSGGSQGLQDVITVDPALTTNNTITNGANVLTITGTDAGLTTTDGVLIVNNTTTPGANNAIVANTDGTNGRGFSGYAPNGVGVYGEGANGLFGLGLSTGVGVYGQSTDGPGGLFTSTSTVGGTFFTNPTSTSTSAPIITLTRSTSGAGAANGLAGRIDFNMENAAGTAIQTNRLVARYTDVTAGSEDTEFDIYGLVNGVTTLFGTFNSTGLVGGGGLTQEQVEDIVGALFGTDNGDIDFTYNDGTPDIAAQIKAGAVGNTEVAAGVDAVKIADGSVTNTEFQHINTVTSNVQTQIDGKANTALSNLASVAVNTSLISDADNTDDLGSTANAWKDIYGKNFLADGSTSGGVEFKSDALGNAPLITTLSGTGYSTSYHETRLTSDYTHSNVNTVQAIFDPGQDVFTAQASTTYDFELFISLSHGGASHSVGISFELGGGASLTSINYVSLAWPNVAINTTTATQTTTFVNQATNTAINQAGANGTEHIFIRGSISVNAAGTITPSFTYSNAPGGTCVTKAGSFMRVSPKGTNTYTTIGAWN